MQLAFILTMPGNNSWNGKWSGDGRCYCILKSFTSQKAMKRAAKVAEKGSYGYDFGDGWYARITVKIVDASEARKLRKESKGFYGYDWMIPPIMEYGKIMRDDQIEDLMKNKLSEMGLSTVSNAAPSVVFSNLQ